MATKLVVPATLISTIFSLLQHYFPERCEVYFKSPKRCNLCLFLGDKIKILKKKKI